MQEQKSLNLLSSAFTEITCLHTGNRKRRGKERRSRAEVKERQEEKGKRRDAGREVK